MGRTEAKNSYICCFWSLWLSHFRVGKCDLILCFLKKLSWARGFIKNQMLREARIEVLLWVQSQCGLHSEFEVSLDYWLEDTMKCNKNGNEKVPNGIEQREQN